MYHAKFNLGAVALNVRNLNLQSQYYQEVLGMDVLLQSESSVELGIDQQVLVRLLQTEAKEAVSDSYGLYHFAILVPTREDLGGNI